MNRLDLAWIRGRLDDHCPEVIAEQEVPNRAAVAAILRYPDGRGSGGDEDARADHDDGCQLLFILRAQQPNDPWSGHMAFPGGRREEQDTTLLDAARRETREELSIDLARHGELLGQLDDVHASARGRVVPLVITPFVFLLTEPVTPAPNEEVDEVHWIPATRLLDPAAGSTVPYVLDGQRYDLPCFEVASGRVIWGLTYQMLWRLFGVLDWQVGR
jgi:8-oxo-dGTP pyrophosphatase MutT (NUDIX family)